MFEKIKKEYLVFESCPYDMRVLLITNLLYALVQPVVEIFVGAYIMRNYGKPSYVALYQLAMYCGIVLTSIINGSLLKYIKVAHLYCIGILFSSVAMVGMMSIRNLDLFELFIIGMIMGGASGFFWTNRYLIALDSTNDDNRNYFFGFESFGFTFGQIVVPLVVGAMIAQLQGERIMGFTFDVNSVYILVALLSTIISIIACVNILRGHFRNPEARRFLYFRFDKLWNKMLGLAFLNGMVQGFLVTAPAILVMKFVGGEGILGVIQSISGGLTAILVYVLGRTAKPQHRIYIFAVGLLIFFMGTLANGILYSALGVILFILCKVIFQPLHDLAYYPIMMRTIDVVSAKEHRNEYAYIQSHEVGLFLGRSFGLLLFLALAVYVSEDFALKFAIPIVGGIQLLSIPLAKNIIASCNGCNLK
ncbi:MAG: MFS transporter [Prevotella sp.]|jgi:YQGE family putative transporter|nr:MFS transporter [Prevotella sp.]MCH3985984.1 MFS transporter [Prevotella sp.]MCH3991325.1 MFS transporter [Prevotella sp.]MCH4018498.1 MFS transporter [Prevotella sp.]MCH4100392.1 MFS transporter [Prevotella sp.]